MIAADGKVLDDLFDAVIGADVCGDMDHEQLGRCVDARDHRDRPIDVGATIARIAQPTPVNVLTVCGGSAIVSPRSPE